VANSTDKRRDAVGYTLEPMMLAVLSRRFEAICREMTNGILKASRSAVIKNARDFSVGILTHDHRLINVEDGLPIHITALDLTTRAVDTLFDDTAEGDAYLNNCPYFGATHHADLDVIVPVFVDGRIMFWALARCHHADMGAPLPTTYLPNAATIYEEGLHFPCVRVEERYISKTDIVRIGLTNIRASKIWHGDYQAQLGACRIGEQRLKDLVARHGAGLIEDSIIDWMTYGERRTKAAIASLPAGKWSYQTKHDPVPGVAEQGIPVRVTVSVDPQAGEITVDARDNIDCVPGGLNLSEATATASCRIGVFVNLDPTIPHNEGSARCINVLLRDGCVVGRPAYPAGTSVATTNVNDRLINAVACCFAQMGAPHGIAEGGAMMASGMAVVSGTDPLRGDRAYVNQLFVGYSGGPGIHGHDGWLTYNDADTCGMLMLDLVEVDEGMYPILIEQRGVAPDTMGHGRWDGAPAMTGVYGPIAAEMTAIYCSDGDETPARGVLGGHDGAPTANWKRHADGRWVKMPSFHTEICQLGEALRFVAGGGGGYGDPGEREPASVVETVNLGWLSAARAEAVYKVKLRRSEDGLDHLLDEAATARLRAGAGR
jgi:N-methylhydantoinase B